MWGSQTVAGDCPAPRWCCTWACTRVVGVAWVHHLWCRSGSTGSAVGCGSCTMQRSALLVTRYTQLPCAVHLDSSHVRRCNYHNVLLVASNIWARHSARNAATATLYTRVISCANHMCLVPGEYRIPAGWENTGRQAVTTSHTRAGSKRYCKKWNQKNIILHFPRFSVVL